MIDGKITTLKEQEKPVNREAVIKSTKQRAMLRNNPPPEKNQKNQKGGEKKEQKIDFKAKSIKAKENSVKKAIARTMVKSGGKGPNTGAG